MLYGSEIWVVKEEDVHRLRCTEVSMVRWMCGASLKDKPGGIRIANYLRSRIGLKYIRYIEKRQVEVV